MSNGNWEPFWLGSPARPLYAALHPVPGVPPVGVVLVPPLLDEQPRSRRFIAEVASELAELGLPSLRFDFLGTGDSCGRGDEVDFQSMRCDLDLATAALRARTGARRVVLVAWSGAALVVHNWLARGGAADLVVLWDALPDGARWLKRLVQADAETRATQPPPRPGVSRPGDAPDGQLMGFMVSPRLRHDLARARLDAGLPVDRSRMWAVAREEDLPSPVQVERVVPLPASAPRLEGGPSMAGTLFMTPPMRELVRGLGSAICATPWI
ncbi:hypothetical protein ACW7G2_08960 [Luteimonas sp. A277]